jgi:hypothetical protein
VLRGHTQIQLNISIAVSQGFLASPGKRRSRCIGRWLLAYSLLTTPSGKENDR